MTEINPGLNVFLSKNDLTTEIPPLEYLGEHPGTALLAKMGQKTALFRKHSTQNGHLFNPTEAPILGKNTLK
ncbi:hypothetical protein GF326_04440 [Candidatus Bathyarchaeota archaeon]|nr:hypothetical protein [Candidatus Bathyarchaeota archaeon]